MRRAVVTGIGLVHPHGEDPEALEAALASGAPPPGPTIQDLDYRAYFPARSKRAKKMDRVGRYASCAALAALRDAGLEAPPTPARAGLVTGTAFGGLEACASFHREMLQAGPDAINPIHFPNTSHNVAAGHVAISLGIQGPVLALATGLAAGVDAVLAATRMISTGRADLVVAGAFDRWIPELEAALRELGLEVGEGGLRPAEGACFLVLEEEGSARERGARILGRVVTWGQASSLRGGFDREGRGLARALGLALRRADGCPDLAGAATGAQGTRAYDAALAAAYDTVLGGTREDFLELRPKRALGETFGPAGVLAVAGVLTGYRSGRIPPGPMLVDGLAWGGAASVLLVAPERRGSARS